MKLFKTIGLSVVTLALAFVGSLFIYQAMAAFVTPTATPPQGNVALPINVSNNLQVKDGPLSATAYYDTDDPVGNYYINPSGTSKLGGDLWLGKDGTDLHRIVNLADPEPNADTDAATKGYVDSQARKRLNGGDIKTPNTTNGTLSCTTNCGPGGGYNTAPSSGVLDGKYNVYFFTNNIPMLNLKVFNKTTFSILDVKTVIADAGPSDSTARFITGQEINGTLYFLIVNPTGSTGVASASNLGGSFFSYNPILKVLTPLNNLPPIFLGDTININFPRAAVMGDSTNLYASVLTAASTYSIYSYNFIPDTWTLISTKVSPTGITNAFTGHTLNAIVSGNSLYWVAIPSTSNSCSLMKFDKVATTLNVYTTPGPTSPNGNTWCTTGTKSDVSIVVKGNQVIFYSYQGGGSSAIETYLVDTSANTITGLDWSHWSAGLTNFNNPTLMGIGFDGTYIYELISSWTCCSTYSVGMAKRTFSATLPILSTSLTSIYAPLFLNTTVFSSEYLLYAVH